MPDAATDPVPTIVSLADLSDAEQRLTTSEVVESTPKPKPKPTPRRKIINELTRNISLRAALIKRTYSTARRVRI